MNDTDDAHRRETVHVHVFHHFDAPLTVLLGKAHNPATKATLTVGETPMSTATINVDTTNATATVGFVDDHGDTDATAPVGVVATFTSDNPAALTVNNDTANPLQGDLVPVAEGVSNVGVTLANADGTPLLEADGVTPWAAIDAVAVTVDPGAAVGAQLSVNP